MCIRDRPTPYYSVRYDKVSLSEVANSEREFPKEWMNEKRNDVTDAFITYAKPLIGSDWVSVPLEDGIMRLARLKPIFAEQKLSPYIPQGYRTQSDR